MDVIGEDQAQLSNCSTAPFQELNIEALKLIHGRNSQIHGNRYKQNCMQK